MVFNEQHQNPGNPIPSASWNNIIDEMKRLGAAKVDVTGGTVSGALSVQQGLNVIGPAAVGGATINGTMSVAGQASFNSGANVNGSINVTGTASVNGNTSVGGLRVGGGGAPAQDTAEIVGTLLLGTMTGGNPLRFTSQWMGFPDSKPNQSEICNSIQPEHTSLMIVGNRSRGGARMVGVWDKLEVHGQSCATSFCNLSDGRLKTDVETIANPLERLARLRGVTFRWRETPAESEGPSMASPLPSPPEDPRYGVVAQEVEEVFPTLVSRMGAQQHLGVDYGGLTAVLIEAVNQLRAENTDLRARVTALEDSAHR